MQPKNLIISCAVQCSVRVRGETENDFFQCHLPCKFRQRNSKEQRREGLTLVSAPVYYPDARLWEVTKVINTKYYTRILININFICILNHISLVKNEKKRVMIFGQYLEISTMVGGPKEHSQL